MTEASNIAVEREEVRLGKEDSGAARAVVGGIQVVPAEPQSSCDLTTSSTPPSSFDSAASLTRASQSPPLQSSAAPEQAPQEEATTGTGSREPRGPTAHKADDDDGDDHDRRRCDRRAQDGDAGQKTSNPEAAIGGPPRREPADKIPHRVAPRFSPAARLSGSCPTSGGGSHHGSSGGSRRGGGRKPEERAAQAVGARGPTAAAAAAAAAVQVVRPCPVKKAPVAGGGEVGPVAVPAPQAKATVAFAVDHTGEAAPKASQQQLKQQRPTPIGQPSAELEARQRKAQQLQLQQQQQQLHLQQQQQQRQREAAARAKEQQEREKAKRRQEAQCAFPPPSQQLRVQNVAHRGAAAVNMGSRQAADGGHRSAQLPMANGGTKTSQHHRQPPPAARQARADGAPAPSAYPHPPAPPAQGKSGRSARAAAPATAKVRVSSSSDADPSSVAAAAAGGGGGGQAGAAPPTLLFERLVSEEVQELKAYARIIETQNRRIAELERVHEDLEKRLERQTNERLGLEVTLEVREKHWASRCDALEKERDQWKKTVDDERTKNQCLLDLVYRKDKEIHRMIQRKYDSAKNPPQQHSHGHGHSHRGDIMKRGLSERSHVGGGSKGRSLSPANRLERHKSEQSLSHDRHKSEQSLSHDRHKSPYEILEQSGHREAVRERNVTNSLLDFFGM